MWTEEQFWDCVRVSGPDDCWPWERGQNTWGYGKLGWRGRVLGAHQVAFMLTKGPLVPGLDVMHSCNNRLCCNPAHLSQGTRQQNLEYAATLERMPNTKLTVELVVEARALYEVGISVTILADTYGVTYSTMYKVVHRRSWRHVG